MSPDAILLSALRVKTFHQTHTLRVGVCFVLLFSTIGSF